MRESSDRGSWVRFALPGLLALLSVSIAAGGEPVQTWLRFDREAILAGELWRLLTGHLAHLSWSHLGLNLAGLAFLWALFQDALSARQWWIVALTGSLGVSAGLWIGNPDLIWYVGLSGVLHTFWAAGAWAQWRRGYREGALLLVALVAKLAWEQWQGPMPGNAMLAGGTVIVDAHAYGAAAGWLSIIVLGRSKPAD